MTEHDLEIFCKTLYGECRGESLEGQVAVACVILNRFNSKKWFSADTIAGVCQKDWQFSCWNKNDPNRKILENLDRKDWYKFVAIVNEAQKKDIIEGCCHYCTNTVADKTSWAKDKTPDFIIGNHFFYKDIS